MQSGVLQPRVLHIAVLLYAYRKMFVRLSLRPSVTLAMYFQNFG